MRTLARLAAVAALSFAAVAARADSLATVPPIGAGPYPVGCTNVEQDFSRVPMGESAESYWEGQPAPSGADRYVTDLLVGNAPVLGVQIPGDSELFSSYAGSFVPTALIVCYPTDAQNPYPNYTLPTGNVVPHMQPSFGVARVDGSKARWPLMLFSHGLGGSPI